MKGITETRQRMIGEATRLILRVKRNLEFIFDNIDRKNTPEEAVGQSPKEGQVVTPGVQVGTYRYSRLRVYLKSSMTRAGIN